MALKVIWTLSANQDRMRVFEYWNERTKSRGYSQKLSELIQHRISLIKEYPSAGLLTDRQDVRFHIISRHYKLFYKIDGDMANLLRFWDTKQDPAKLKMSR